MKSHGDTELYKYSSIFYNHFYDEGSLGGPLGVNRVMASTFLENAQIFVPRVPFRTNQF